MIDNILLLFTDNKLITLFITMIGTIYWLFGKIRAELNDKKKEFMEKILVTDTSVQSFKSEIKEKLTQNPNLYRIELKRVLGFLDKHLGELKLFSFQALDRHFAFSLIYSFLFFYLVWLFGGDGRIGTHQLIPNENKLGISLYLIFEIVIIYLLLTNLNKIHQFFIKYIPRFSQLSNTWQTILVLVLVGVVGVVGVGVVVGVGAINTVTITYLLFFLFLPLINSIFDYLSMIASRFFAQKILNTHKKATIFIDIFLDIIVASLLFVALAFTLYHVIEFTNIYLIKNEALFIPIEHYKQLMLSGDILNPDVLWITLMFVSTLIPTFIHLYLFVYSLMAFMVVKPHLHQIVEDLEELDLENYHKKEQVAYALADYRLTGWLRVHNFFVSALAIGCCVIFGVIVAQIDFNSLVI